MGHYLVSRSHGPREVLIQRLHGSRRRLQSVVVWRVAEEVVYVT